MVKRRIPEIAVSLATLISAAAISPHVEAGPQPYGHAAIHVVAHGTSCKSLPALDSCDLINTAYIGMGDVDVIPAFYWLDSYTAVEFGLSWPADWGTCSFVPCGTGVVLGSICNPGDGIIKLWPTCQGGASIVVGYGWLTAQSSGRVELIDSPWPLNGRLGVSDCAQTFHPPIATYSAGIGWIAGDEPCLPAMDPLVVEVSDDASGSCVTTRDTLCYLISIYNVNMYDVHDVVLVDSLPPGTVYVSGGTYDEQTRVLRLVVGTIQSGDEALATFSLQITAPAGSTITNNFAVMCGEYWPRPATHSRQVCGGPATDATTWGQIKAIFR